MTESQSGMRDRPALLDDLREAARLRAIPAIRELMPFLTGCETGCREYDDAPFAEFGALAVLKRLGDVRGDLQQAEILGQKGGVGSQIGD